MSITKFLILIIVCAIPLVGYAQAAQTRLDLVVSAQTYTPSFYNGRALPTSGSRIQVNALLFDTTQLDANLYSYIWEVNGKTQSGVVGESLSFTPNFETESIVSVTVSDSTGVIVGEKTIAIPIFKPQLYFYERNPLRGVIPIAFSDKNYFIGEELTLHVEPYFIDTRTEKLTTQWEINREVITQSGNPFELTLQKQQETGGASISFRIFNPQQLLQNAKESIRFQF